MGVCWIDWLVVGAPFSLSLSIALYFVLMRMMTPGADEAEPRGTAGRRGTGGIALFFGVMRRSTPGADEGEPRGTAGRRGQAGLSLGLAPMSSNEKKLLVL